MQTDRWNADERTQLDDILRGIENEFIAFGSRFINDSAARQRYTDLILKNSQEIRNEALKTGNFKGAMEYAHALRNEVMDQIRVITSDLGRATAEFAKKEGRLLDDLINEKSMKLFKQEFKQITDPVSQRKVFLEVIESSGRPSRGFTVLGKAMGNVGRGFVVATIGITVYNVATAEDKFTAVKKEATSIALGSAFSVAGGWFGAFCGPGAVVCVPLGVFVGGAVGAVAADLLY